MTSPARQTNPQSLWESRCGLNATSANSEGAMPATAVTHTCHLYWVVGHASSTVGNFRGPYSLPASITTYRVRVQSWRTTHRAVHLQTATTYVRLPHAATRSPGCSLRVGHRRIGRCTGRSLLRPPSHPTAATLPAGRGQRRRRSLCPNATPRSRPDHNQSAPTVMASRDHPWFLLRKPVQGLLRPRPLQATLDLGSNLSLRCRGTKAFQCRIAVIGIGEFPTMAGTRRPSCLWTTNSGYVADSHLGRRS